MMSDKYATLPQVALPTTLEEFDKLVDELCLKYTLANKEHAASVVSVAIRHLPNDQAETSHEYLISCIRKNLANGIAAFKGDTLKHEYQVKLLADELTVNPNNMQARDELQKAANAGSKCAVDAMAKFGDMFSVAPIDPTGSNVLPMVNG
jgi:hypothetical protein